MTGTFWIHDTTLCVSYPDESFVRDGLSEASKTLWRRIEAALKRKGFSVGVDEKLKATYPSLSKWHRYGRRGDLELKIETYPVGGKLDFFQNLVITNRNGGEYDFDRRTKMPYLIGKSYELAIRQVCRVLIAAGYRERTKLASPNPDPLSYFNARWDGDYEVKRGTHRFKRGEDGWPVESELGAYGRRDADGAVIGQGEIRYARDRAGYLMRGRVWGGINGRWIFVLNAGEKGFTHLSSHELFAWRPDLERKVATKVTRSRLKAELDKAVSSQNFEKAIVLRDLVARKFTAPTPMLKAA